MIEAPSLFRDPESFRAACDAARSRGLKVGFVPTMGALHEGHLALAAKARERASFTAVSIFVNPTQFGPNEDFSRYPRDEKRDVELLAGAKVDAIFLPTSHALYVDGERTRVRVAELTDHLCGPFRPGHFEGVATVVAKFFSLVGPSVAVFGRKDYQQLAVLRRMTKDLFMPIDIVGVTTVRESGGLALSSRNRYLSDADRARALVIPRALATVHARYAAGERNARNLVSPVREMLTNEADSVDYADIADADSLVPFDESSNVGDRAVIAVALRIGKTRLIDNVVLGEDPSPLALP